MLQSVIDDGMIDQLEELWRLIVLDAPPEHMILPSMRSGAAYARGLRQTDARIDQVSRPFVPRRRHRTQRRP